VASSQVSGLCLNYETHRSAGPVSAAAPILLDRVLLILITVEIVYTAVLSLRAHRLVAQPFISSD
jgi:hypothetical protein